MGPELCQVLYRSASVPSRGFWEEKRTCPRNSSSKVPVHPGVQASPPCPAIVVLLPSAGEQPGWHQMSPWGVLVPPRVGWGKRGTKLTSFPCFIHDYSRPRCWILILVHILFLWYVISPTLYQRGITIIKWPLMLILIFDSVKSPLYLSFLDCFFKVENQVVFSFHKQNIFAVLKMGILGNFWRILTFLWLKAFTGKVKKCMKNSTFLEGFWYCYNKKEAKRK